MREALVIGLAALSLAGCESTQSKSARLESEGITKLAAEKGLVVEKPNAGIEVVETVGLEDENGAAAVVVMKNRTAKAMRNVPIAINALGKSGKSVFKNNTPGLEDALTSIAALPPGEETAWVNDQLVPTGPVAKIKAVAGEEGGVFPSNVPELEVGPPELYEDPVSGVEATGRVENRSGVDQRLLTLYCIARRSGRIVAAGVGRIERLRAGKRANYHIFFIGNPRGAELTVIAPPTTPE